MSKKKLVVFGCSGFGREVMCQIDTPNMRGVKYEILGFVDDNSDVQGTRVNDYPVVGNAEWLINYPEEINVVIAVGNSQVRKKIVDKISSNKNIMFPTIIAGNVIHSASVKFGKGCIICFSSILTVNIECGDFVIINLDCTVGHDAKLNDYVTLYPSVNVSGNVNVGECAEIGTGTNIIQGKNIGANTIIGAGSLVVKDLQANCTAVGAPAKAIKMHTN